MGSLLGVRAAVVVTLSTACFVACGSTNDVTPPPAGDDAGATSEGGGGDGAPTPPPAPTCGRNFKPCQDGEKCDGPPDCVSGVCRSGVCQAAKPADGVKNGDETDVDCGGSSAPACANGLHCAVADDCQSGVCTGGVCQVPNDHDGVKNGDETGVDCGGSATNKCAPGQGCKTNGDCANVACDFDGTHLCQDPSHTDGIMNDGETDVDCGGTAPNKCEVGQGCTSNADCNALKCDVAATNKCLPASHTDGVENLGETGIDCGGAALPAKCPTGQGCVSNADCDAVACDVGKSDLCLPPSHTDGILNDGETGIDCGGAALPAKCPTGQGCSSDADCNNVRCVGTPKVCDSPRNNDGLQNGTETDIDCGGGAPTNAPKCTFGKGCTAATDCKGGACDAGKKCTIPSCGTAETAGIVTCGAGETGAAGAVHESCCKSLTLPSRTTRRLDKYEVTSGRFRTFLASAGPDIQTWVSNYITAHPTSQLATLVNLNKTTVLSIYPNADRFVAHSLTAHMEIDIDNYNGIRGCYNGAGDYAANTYWMDATHEADFGLPARSLARSVSDEKPLNCAMPMMFAAFCAWDGDGELATLADYADAWPSTYPWGATDLLRPKYNWCNGTYLNGGFTCQCDGTHNLIPSASCPAPATQFQVNGENGVFYEYPIATDRSLDNEPLIAAPGRMTTDATLLQSGGESWMDLYANLAEYTGDFSASANDWCDFSVDGGAGGCTRSLKSGTGVHYTNIPKSGIIGQTWEGHQYNKGTANGFAVTFQYGKFGGRCVRPVGQY